MLSYMRPPALLPRRPPPHKACQATYEDKHAFCLDVAMVTTPNDIRWAAIEVVVVQA